MQVGKIAGPSGPVRAGPCTMVILGAAGDLTRRKLLPSLLHLEADGALHEEFAVVGVGREPLSDEAFRDQVRAALGASGGLWQRFAPRLFYAAGNLKEPATYDDLARRLRLLESTGGERGRLFYLAVPPSVYETAIEGLNLDFADIVARGRIEAMEPTPEERDDNQFVNLPRIGFEFNRRDYGRLRQLIDVLNSF